MLHKLSVLGLGQLARTATSVSRHGLTLLALLHSVKHTKGFVEDETQTLSYGQLYSQSLALAYYLHSTFGVSQKSRVAIAGRNSVGFVKALFAASGLGADVVLLNPGQKEGYYSRFMASHNIDIILGDATLASLLPPAIPFFDYEGAIAQPAINTKAVTRKKGSLVVLSGGSTGVPKAERRTISALTYLDPLTDIISKLRLKESPSVLISVPLFHGYGLAALALSVFMGKGVYLAKKFDAAATLSLLQHNNPHCWIAVPLMVQKVLAVSQNLSVHSIICGGDVLPPSVVQALHTTQVKVYNLYGTSQTGVCTIATDAHLRKHPGTLGTTIKGIKAKIAPDSSLSVKCAWSAEGNKGYVPTGDIVTQNAAGYYFYKGRTDDMMVIGGENVYPIEIENAACKHPAIKWAKAKGITLNHTTMVHVDIVLHDNTVYDEPEFLAHIAGELPGYMVPKSVTVLQQEPATKLM
jgi:fatty-acyl-CoA synthase